MSILTRLAKAITPEQMRFPRGSGFRGASLPRTRINYAAENGDGTGTSVVMAVVQWVQRAAQEAEFVVQDSDGERVDGHPVAALVNSPNPAYARSHLLNAALLDYITAGNGFWLPVANGGGVPVELWYAPAAAMAPRFPADGSEFLSHWEYTPGGTGKIRLQPEDVIHFRHGIDPGNQRLGMSPLRAVQREIFTDLEASNFTASMLRNMGAPGIVLSPRHEQQMSADEAASVKKWIAEAFRGDRRGEPLVMGMPTDISEYGYSPDKMALAAVRNVAEERVSAALGIPAAVVGFGSGLEQTKVGATMGELRKLAWTNGVLPILNVFAATLTDSLLSEQDRARGLRCAYDTRDVAAMQDDATARTTRWDMMVRGGWATIAEARAAAGLETAKADEVYMRNFSLLEVPQGQSAPALEAPPKVATKAKAERPDGREFIRAMHAMQKQQADAMGASLTNIFVKMGEDGREAALNKARKEITEDDKAMVRRILQEMDIPEHSDAFKQTYEFHYLEVGSDVSDALGLGVDIPDPVARSVAAAGGKRAGLIDLEAQTKDALFKSIAEARADGLGPDALARKIRDGIEAGPWADKKTRAKVIARTETKFAQNASAVAIGKDAGAELFIIFDGRFGPDVASDEPDGAPAMATNLDTMELEVLPTNHAARGQGNYAVTADEAATMTAMEHPNGTLSFSPFFEGQ